MKEFNNYLINMILNIVKYS